LNGYKELKKNTEVNYYEEYQEYKRKKNEKKKGKVENEGGRKENI